MATETELKDAVKVRRAKTAAAENQISDVRSSLLPDSSQAVREVPVEQHIAPILIPPAKELKSRHVNVLLRPSLIDRAAKLAMMEGTTKNAIIGDALAAYLDAKGV